MNEKSLDFSTCYTVSSDKISKVDFKEKSTEVTSKEVGTTETPSDLFFEKENSVPDFEREPIYDVDNFGKNSFKIEKMLMPPPDFKEALNKLPVQIQADFKRILNADIVGVWPIKGDILLNKK